MTAGQVPAVNIWTATLTRTCQFPGRQDGACSDRRDRDQGRIHRLAAEAEVIRVVIAAAYDAIRSKLPEGRLYGRSIIGDGPMLHPRRSGRPQPVCGDARPPARATATSSCGWPRAFGLGAPLDRLGSPEGSSNYVRSSVNAFTVLKPVDTVRKGGVYWRCVLVPEGADHGAADHNCRRRFRNWFSLSAASA